MGSLAQFVLLPGLHGTGYLFKPLTRLLPSKVFEYPGQGPQDYATQCAWLGRQKFPPSYVMVAESYGGPLALLHAAARPRGLKGLVLLGSFANMGMPLAWLVSCLLPPLPLGSPWFGRVLQRSLFNGSAGPGAIRAFQSGLKSSPWIYRARMQAVMRGDVRPVLSEIQVPVLSLRATHDRMVPAQAEAGLSGIPQLSSAVIDSPHVIAGTRPEALKKILLKFRRSLR